MGKTFVEKVLSRAAGKDVRAGDIVTVSPDYIVSHENTSAIWENFKEIGVEHVWDPSRIVVIFDHTVPASTEEYAESHKATRRFISEQKIEHFYDMLRDGGICHQIMCQEGFAAPSRIILGADSHTCTAGAMGAFAAGIGRTEAAAVWATGETWLMIPQSLKINVSGSFRPYVTAKDLILTIIGDLRADGANYLSVEFEGEGIEAMSIAERMTVCNMVSEMGAKNGVCKPDRKVHDMLAQNDKGGSAEFLWSDPDADYISEYSYNLEDIVPCVAKPYKVDQYSPIDGVKGIKADQVFIGTCTNGRLEDLRIAAQILSGKHVKIRTIVQPASAEIFRKAEAEGIVRTLLNAGCMIMAPGCGPCIGVYGGVLASGEVCVSTSNRNFRGRMGSGEAKIYLASPAVAAATAQSGYIADPREVLEL